MYNLLFSCNNKDSKIYNKNKHIKIDIVTRGTTVTEVFQKNQVLVTLELALFLTIPYLEYME
jgi:exopolysaccharide biosynthesis predicted pyruvyltransferase EpsI